MRLSFREFHLQFDPTLRRERVPEAMFELLGPPPSAKPVFEGPSESAPKAEAQPAAEAAEPQLDGTAAADTPAEAVTEPAEAAADKQEQADELEVVPDLAAQLFSQVHSASGDVV